MACRICEDRKKERSEDEKKHLINRLKRIEGQIRGIIAMVENDTYCPDIINQVAAVNAALNSFNREMISKHVSGCIHDDLEKGNSDSMDEFLSMLKKLMK